MFAHFCSDYFDNATCQDKHVKEKGYKGGFRELKEFKEMVSGHGKFGGVNATSNNVYYCNNVYSCILYNDSAIS